MKRKSIHTYCLFLLVVLSISVLHVAKAEAEGTR